MVIHKQHSLLMIFPVAIVVAMATCNVVDIFVLLEAFVVVYKHVGPVSTLHGNLHTHKIFHVSIILWFPC